VEVKDPLWVEPANLRCPKAPRGKVNLQPRKKPSRKKPERKNQVDSDLWEISLVISKNGYI